MSSTSASVVLRPAVALGSRRPEHALILLAVTCSWSFADVLAPEMGGANFGLYTFAIGLYLYCERRFPVPASLTAFAGLTLVYMALSLGSVLPRAWTTLYEPSAIPHQALFVIMPVLVAGYRRFFTRMWNDRTVFTWLLLMSFLCWIAIPPDSAIQEPHRAQWEIYGTDNGLLIFYISLAHLFLSHAKPKGKLQSSAASFLVVLFLALVSLAEQNRLLLIAFVVLAWLPAPRFILATALFFGIAGYAVLAARFAPLVWAIHADSGVRLALANDAFAGALQTFGVGIGFGREIVRNQSIIDLAQTLFVRDESRQILIGTHNSFIDVFFRMGVAGLATFVWFVFGACFPRGAGRRSGPRAMADMRAACFVFAVAFTAIFFNVGLSSPYYLFGVSAAFGYLLAFRDVSRPVARAAGTASKDGPMQHDYVQPGAVTDDSPLSDIVAKLWNRRAFLAAICIVAALASSWYAIHLPRTYTVQMTLGPASRIEENGSSSSRLGSSLLQSLPLGNLLQGTQSVQFEKFLVLLTSSVIAQRLADQGYLQRLYKGEWDPHEMEWHPPNSVLFRATQSVKDFLGLGPWLPPTATDLSATLSGSLKMDKLTGTAFTKVSWSTNTPDLAKDVMLDLHRTTEAYILADQVDEKQHYMHYLEGQIGNTTLAEERQSIASLIGQTEYELMLLHSGRPYTAVILDGPTIYRDRLFVRIMLFGVGGLIFGFVVAGLFIIGLERRAGGAGMA